MGCSPYIYTGFKRRVSKALNLTYIKEIKFIFPKGISNSTIRITYWQIEAKKISNLMKKTQKEVYTEIKMENHHWL